MKHVESNIMIQQLGISKDNYFMGRFKILFGSVYTPSCRQQVKHIVCTLHNRPVCKHIVFTVYLLRGGLNHFLDTFFITILPHFVFQLQKTFKNNKFFPNRHEIFEVFLTMIYLTKIMKFSESESL